MSALVEYLLLIKIQKSLHQYNTEGNCVISASDPEHLDWNKYRCKKFNRIKQPFKKYPWNNIAYAIQMGRKEYYGFSPMELVEKI